MAMDGSYFVKQLADDAGRFEALVKGVSEEQAHWKPDDDEWSVLELVNHLYDEEREDFRVRLDNILHHPEREWAQIDPEGWVTERAYGERDLDASVQDFLEERNGSLEWLESLGSPDWDTLYTSEYGSMRAGDMFTSWVTHDHIHLRQLIGLHHAYAIAQGNAIQPGLRRAVVRGALSRQPHIGRPPNALNGSGM